MKRQGLITTVEELRTLADELEAQIQLNNFEITAQCGHNTKFQLNIINKSGLSDEWEFEKEPNQKLNTSDKDALTKTSPEASRIDGRRIIMTGCPDEMEDVYDS